jgi:hypothetical protein
MSRRSSILLLTMLVVDVVWGQWWEGPYRLTSDSGADVNPSVCREWMCLDWAQRSALVWQTDRDGSWDVYARVHAGEWLPEQRIAGTVLDEVRPAVICAWDSAFLQTLWCVFERRDTGGITVMASRCAAGDTLWQIPEPIGGAFCDSACLSGITVPVGNPDTPRVWVAWRTLDQGRWRVVCAVNDGDSWHAPQVAVEDSVELRHPRLGRGWRRERDEYPLLVWERGGDIMASEYRQGVWTTPVEVAPSESLDTNPEVVSVDPLYCGGGAWVVWQSRRLGHWSLCAAHGDTLDQFENWSEPGSEANDLQPSGTPAAFTTDWDLSWVVYTSDREGGSDIYSRCEYEPAVWVDTFPSTDRNPCLTTIGWTLLWVVWQSDRSGNEDLFGSFFYATGMEEKRASEAEYGAVNQTHCRGMLMLSGKQLAVLLDITGRRVMDLQPGENDIRGVAPGVYFVRRPETEDGRQRTVVRKVVIQR